MIDFDKYKKNKERERKEIIASKIEELEEANNELNELIRKNEMYLNNGKRPSDESIDILFDSVMNVIRKSDELDKTQGIKSTFSEIVDGAGKMMEKNEIRIVK